MGFRVIFEEKFGDISRVTIAAEGGIARVILEGERQSNFRMTGPARLDLEGRFCKQDNGLIGRLLYFSVVGVC